MAVIQSDQSEIRYLKRKNLEEEARIIGNYYRDAIRLYGIDCIYHKLDMSTFDDFKNIIDRNAVLRAAYGCELNPDYGVSADMVVFAEIDQDIFNLNKFGYLPNTDINLVFDGKQFACDLAPCIGAYKEYRIKQSYLTCEVPSPESLSVEGAGPFVVGGGRPEYFECEGLLSGLFKCDISAYEPDVEYTLPCDPYEHVDFEVKFPANEDLYHSLSYHISNDKYLETMLFLTFKIRREGHMYVLDGRLHGSVLFFDLDQLGKYVERIKPSVGDIVEIDFPDEYNREKYEITECYDKQLSQDGINPLLHKYVWRCKARRYVNSYEPGAPADTEADKRMAEREKYDEVVQEEITKQVAMYDSLDDKGEVDENAVYGGYDGVLEGYDKQVPVPENHRKYCYIPDGVHLNVAVFGCGSKLVTNGYDLVFVDASGKGCDIVMAKDPPCGTVFESGARWLKATKNQVLFVDVEGCCSSIALCPTIENQNDDEHPLENFEINIDSLYDHTVDTADSINMLGDGFFKFRNCRTLLFATPDSLYAKLEYDGKTYKLV